VLKVIWRNENLILKRLKIHGCLEWKILETRKWISKTDTTIKTVRSITETIHWLDKTELREILINSNWISKINPIKRHRHY